MGMNEEILSNPISTLELWFFPDFLILYNTYKDSTMGHTNQITVFLILM
jgi:hypothetical protein